MIYAPHILQRKVVSQSRDELGRVITDGREEWETLCRCRCDNNSTKTFTSVNGSVYRPYYHVVCEGKPAIAEGDYIRCMDGNAVRGEGVVYNRDPKNWFNNLEVWI